jgi:hypothetical protein
LFFFVTSYSSSFTSLSLGGNWLDNSGWNNSSSYYCEWFGITCADDNETVLQIAINANFLIGTIPLSFGSLTSLLYLDLSSNQLSGTIPSSFSSLTSLQQLILGNNKFDGTIASSFGSFTYLWYLNLANNEFSSIDLNQKPPNLTLCFLSLNPFICPIPSWAMGNFCGATCNKIEE